MIDYITTHLLIRCLLSKKHCCGVVLAQVSHAQLKRSGCVRSRYGLYMEHGALSMAFDVDKTFAGLDLSSPGF